MGLGSGFAASASTLSGGSLTTGTIGIGGGSVSVTECFRLRKKEDVFFCSVWAVGCCDSRGGGVLDLGCEKVETWGEEAALDTAVLDDPNILLKNPCFSFGCGVTLMTDGGRISFAFSYPTCGAGADSRSRTGSGGASRNGLNLGSGLRPTVALLEDRVLRRRSGPATFAGEFEPVLDSGGGITGIDGAVVSLRGPPGTVGVGAASYPSLKKELGNSTCHGAGEGRCSPSKLDDLPPKPRAQR
jgi:hypothetical protein